MLELRLRQGGEGVEMELFRPQPDRHFFGSVEEGSEEGGDFLADLYATAGWSGAVLRPRKEKRKEGRGKRKRKIFHLGN